MCAVFPAVEGVPPPTQDGKPPRQSQPWPSQPETERLWPVCPARARVLQWEAGSWPSCLLACGLSLPEPGQCPSLGQVWGHATRLSSIILSLCWYLGTKRAGGLGARLPLPRERRGVSRQTQGAPGGSGALSLASEPMGPAQTSLQGRCAPGPTWPSLRASTADWPSFSSGLLQR